MFKLFSSPYYTAKPTERRKLFIDLNHHDLKSPVNLVGKIKSALGVNGIGSRRMEYNGDNRKKDEDDFYDEYYSDEYYDDDILMKPKATTLHMMRKKYPVTKEKAVGKKQFIPYLNNNQNLDPNNQRPRTAFKTKSFEHLPMIKRRIHKYYKKKRK